MQLLELSVRCRGKKMGIIGYGDIGQVSTFAEMYSRKILQ